MRIERVVIYVCLGRVLTPAVSDYRYPYWKPRCTYRYPEGRYQIVSHIDPLS